MISVNDHLSVLLSPPRLWSSTEVLANVAVPREAGAYAWYFRQVPPGVPVEGCVTKDDLTLLYVGIVPKGPGGRPNRVLAKRLREHYDSNAYSSTLRRTLGCLLEGVLGIQLIRNGKRYTFGDGERSLSNWMAENAFVCWAIAKEPWQIEAEALRTVCLPLNIQHNQHHPFCAMLRACRRAAKNRADGRC